MCVCVCVCVSARARCVCVLGVCEREEEDEEREYERLEQGNAPLDCSSSLVDVSLVDASLVDVFLQFDHLEKPMRSFVFSFACSAPNKTASQPCCVPKQCYPESSH